MSETTGYYYNPTVPETYPSYEYLRYLYPNISLPRNKDMPSLNLYQIYRAPMIDAPEGFYAAVKQWPELDTVTGTYTQVWELLPVPTEPVDP